MKLTDRTIHRPGFFWSMSLIACLAIAAALSEARGQKIVNPGFEEPSLEVLGKSVAQGRDTRSPDGWTFGQSTGICLGGLDQAEGLDAAEGTQVSFLKGAPTADGERRSLAPVGVIGINLTGLEIGNDYELEWVQAGSNADDSLGAVTTIIRDPDDPSVRIAKMNRVEKKGKWQKCSMTFQATAPVMRLFVCHSLPGLVDGTATGEESTLLDDFRIREAN